MKKTQSRRKKAKVAPDLLGRILRLSPAVFHPTALAYMADAASPNPSPDNAFYPPRAAWLEILRMLRVRHDYPGFVDDVTACCGGETVAATYADIANCFAVNLSTVNKWAASGMPGAGRGPYDLVDILAWRLAADERGDENQRRQF